MLSCVRVIPSSANDVAFVARVSGGTAGPACILVKGRHLYISIWNTFRRKSITLFLPQNYTCRRP